ncbi:hypothetical protein [Variovorax sp. UC122_21]|uniref:hypothetical protein n=1 Tax=Variovorax sp. UC122_21 TaxID=3374554 RepID=UPI003757A19E
MAIVFNASSGSSCSIVMGRLCRLAWIFWTSVLLSPQRHAAEMWAEMAPAAQPGQVANFFPAAPFISTRHSQNRATRNEK